jgi:hypothetical protein
MTSSPSTFEILSKIPKTVGGDEPSQIFDFLYLSGHPGRYQSSQTKKAAQHISKYMQLKHGIRLIINCCQPKSAPSEVTFLVETLSTGEKKLVDTLEEFVALLLNDQQQQQKDLFFHVNLRLDDDAEESVNKFFNVTNTVLTAALKDLIADAVNNNNKKEEGKKEEKIVPGLRTLVYCQAGQSRSSTIMAAFIIKHFQLKNRDDDVLEFMHARRSDVNPNDGFRKILCEYAAQL